MPVSIWVRCSLFPLGVRAEENRRTEDALKRPHEPAVLGSALLHSEGVQHLSSAAEGDPRTLLPDRERREKDRDEAVLSPGQTVARVSRDLQNELPVSALMQQAAHGGSLHRQTAKNEWPRREPEVLRFGLPLRPNGTDRICLTKLTLRNDQFRMHQLKNVPGLLKRRAARRNRIVKGGRFGRINVQGLNPRGTGACDIFVPIGWRNSTRWHRDPSVSDCK